MSTDVTTEELWGRDCSVLCSCSRRPTGGEEERRREGEGDNKQSTELNIK